ncbi:MAG: A/G-specific adenine glycosylase [Verrucomicrobia bacterium]|nr:A/G-specific adenine glycosylase [Verrucomicrobiota bacterium]
MKQLRGQPDPREATIFRRRLLRHFRATMRDLPWRRRITPYRVLVAEMMLQQTQVERVKDYFQRWMRRFPSIKVLAAAPLDDVLKHWEGLGYYTRARNLHRAARFIVEKHGGRVPRDFDALRALPGLGRYTAGAVLSIACNLRAPILDGNVARVLCRVFAIRRDPSKAATRRLLWTLSEALIPDGEARDFNQAMMEHGALVCTPRVPKCGACSIKTLCTAQARGWQDRLPVRIRRPKILKHDIGVAVVCERGRYLIQQRPDDDRLGGLWEFPGGKREPRESIAACIRRELIEELGVEVEVGEKLCEVDHTYTHYHVTLHVYRCRITRGRPHAHYAQRIAWARPTDFARYTFPASNLRIISSLRGHGRP